MNSCIKNIDIFLNEYKNSYLNWINWALAFVLDPYSHFHIIPPT